MTVLAEAAVAPWPAWALRLLITLGVATAAASLGKLRYGSAGASSDAGCVDDKATAEKRAAFRRFQRQYLLTHFVISLADWLQGTNMYTLYQSYGVDVGALYLTGFSSSALFSVVVGLYADKQVRDYGRVVYCVLEIVVNALEHVPNFYTLLASRVLGGMSTSLLCSVFESRMVSAHRRKGFPESWLVDTFGLASAGSGFAAILAGVVAQVACDWRGDIGPFQVAIALTVLALALVIWSEESAAVRRMSAAPAQLGVAALSSGADAIKYMRSDLRVTLVGLSQGLFEGVIYTVVFIWVPTVQLALGSEPLPSGLVFSCFMLCLTLGGFTFPLAAARPELLEFCAAGLFAVSALALLALMVCKSVAAVIGALLVFEFCVGLFYPCAATLRSRYIPDVMQDSVMNIIRVPVNILVVVGTWLASTQTPSVVFGTCASWLVIAVVMMLVLAFREAKPRPALKVD